MQITRQADYAVRAMVYLAQKDSEAQNDADKRGSYKYNS